MDEKHKIMQELFDLTDNLLVNNKKNWDKIFNDFKKRMKKNGYNVDKKATALTVAYIKKSYKLLSKKMMMTEKKLLSGLDLNKKMSEIESILHSFNIDSIKQTDLDINTLKEYLEDVYKKQYDVNNYIVSKKIGVIGAFNQPNIDRMNYIINSKFNGYVYSDRMWKYKDNMIKELKKELILNVVGKNNKKSQKDFIEIIRKTQEVKKHQVSRLFRTETTRIASESDKNYYVDSDIKKYEYVATFDKRTSEICRDLDGQVFDSDKMQVGVNAPPMHPNCRSTTVPYFKDTLGRVGRNKEGDSVLFPKEIRNYKQYEEYMKTGKIPKN